jgi:hypothetical protein
MSQEGLAVAQESAAYSGGNDEHAQAVTRPQAAPEAIAEPRPLHSQPLQTRPETPVIDDAGLKNGGSTGQQHSINSGAIHTPVSQGAITSSHENVDAAPTPAKPDTSSAQGNNVVTNAPSDSEDVSAPGMGGENVDTGRERIGQDTVRGKQP